jgi:cell division septation protein DedD
MSESTEHSEGNVDKNAEPRTNEPGTKSGGLFGVRVDHANRELYVSTTRAVAGVSLASFCGLLIGVMALSRHATHTGPQAARASDETPRPSILPPAETAPVVVVKTAPVKPAPAPRPAQVVVTTPTKPAPLVTSTPSHLPTPTTAPSAVTPKAVETAKASDGRIVGMTYLVFGSFPKVGDAKTVSDRLKENGVTCTIERSLPGWTRKGWYSVVSVQGYASSKEAAFKKTVKDLHAKEVEAHGYKWRAVKGN